MKTTTTAGVMARMSEWWRGMRARSKERSQRRRYKTLAREADARVQIREFGGEMYLALDNVPVLPADGIAWDLPTAVAVSREAWVKYHRSE